MTTSSAEFEISCQNIWKVFGPHPERIAPMLASNRSKTRFWLKPDMWLR